MCLECVDLAEQSEVNSHMLDLEDALTYQEEAVAMIEESPMGAEMSVNQPSEVDTCCLVGAYEI